MFENMVLRKIFVSKRVEVTTVEKLHNEELHDLYSSPGIIRMIKSRGIGWAGNVARMQRRGSRIKIPERNRRIGRVDNVKMYFRKMGWGNMDWIDLA
jgi:hypothetical protein